MSEQPKRLRTAEPNVIVSPERLRALERALAERNDLSRALRMACHEVVTWRQWYGERLGLPWGDKDATDDAVQEFLDKARGFDGEDA